LPAVLFCTVSITPARFIDSTQEAFKCLVRRIRERASSEVSCQIDAGAHHTGLRSDRLNALNATTPLCSALPPTV